MYEVRDLGSFLIMVLVAPLFAAVFVIACLFILPLALIHALIRRLCA